MRNPVTIVGRAAERARIERLLADAARGRSGCLVLLGEPGIGKSALLNEAVESAGSLAVLRASGLQPAANIPFTAVAELLRPHLGLLDALPGPQAGALRAALGRDRAEQTDRFAAYAGVLALFAAIAEQGPLLVAVDDAHWLDAASAEALTFAARRIDAEGIAMLFAAVDEPVAVFPAGDLPRMRLGGLDPEDAGRLLGRAGVGAQLVARLVEGTGGNPLALTEVAATLTPGQLRGTEPLTDPLPSAATLGERLAERLVGLAPQARRVLMVAAAGESGDLEHVVAALGHLGLDPLALEEAEARELVSIDAGRVRFAHPLLRSAAYHALGWDDRREAHLAYAATAHPAEPDRRTWHLAQAAEGPDEDVAAELERAARGMAERTGYLAAAEALTRAAALTPEPAAVGPRLEAAAHNAFLGGDLDRTLALTERLLGDEPPHPVRGRILLQRGFALLGRGPIGEAVDAFTSAADLLAPTDPGRASVALTAAAHAAVFGDTAERAVRSARRAVDLAPPRMVAVMATARTMLLGCSLMLGDPGWREVLRHGDPTEGVLDEDLPLAVDAMLWMGEHERALRALNRLLDPAGEDGAAGTVVLWFAARARARSLLGDWDAALSDAHEAARLSALTGHLTVRVQALWVIARICAARGERTACQAASAEVIRLGRDLTMAPAPATAFAALGLLGLTQGDPRAALVHLEAARERLQRMGVANPAAVPYQADLVEALLLCGARDQAMRETTRLLQQAERLDLPLARLMAHRCRTCVVADDGLEALFDGQWDRLAELPYPFERARIELHLAERRLAQGRGMDARPPLESAIRTFRALGAHPWAVRAESALAASGVRVATTAKQQGLPLTHQELQVAMLVGDGLTNKEVAARLFLSAKTVEFHLSNAYRKLGVRSRVELARRVAEGGLGRTGT